jgi:oligopeptide transport system ATP-binding protein
MYSGFIVELAPVRALYKETSHPYTLGLLESLPKIDVGKRERLLPIRGLPPDLLLEPHHCPFAPRCRYVIDRCWEENPPLLPVAPNHTAACWRADELRDGLRILEYAEEEELVPA